MIVELRIIWVRDIYNEVIMILYNENNNVIIYFIGKWFENLII